MLVYIDRKRNQGGHAPRAEYVHRMNMGIRDALREGVPRGYVEGVLREYIPAPGVEEEEGGRMWGLRWSRRGGFGMRVGLFRRGRVLGVVVLGVLLRLLGRGWFRSGRLSRRGTRSCGSGRVKYAI
jgi:hypothetical protein